MNIKSSQFLLLTAPFLALYSTQIYTSAKPSPKQGKSDKPGFFHTLFSIDGEDSERTPIIPQPAGVMPSPDTKSTPTFAPNLSSVARNPVQAPTMAETTQSSHKDPAELKISTSTIKITKNSKPAAPKGETPKTAQRPLDPGYDYAGTSPAEHDCEATAVETIPLAATAATVQDEQLGMPYAIPKLPSQSKADYAWSDIHILREDIDYVLGLIENQTYGLAASKGTKRDNKLPGRNSNGLLSIITALAQQQQSHRTSKKLLLERQRKEASDLSKQALLLLQAINTYGKLIDGARLEEEFAKITCERNANKERLHLEIAEAHALDIHFKLLQEAMHNAHLTGSTSLPLSPRKTVEKFTTDLLTNKR
jgi:hypothetical protein